MQLSHHSKQTKMSQTKQYQLEGHELILRVKKAPVFIRGVLFLFAFLFFAMPISGMTEYVVSGNDFHVAFLFGLVIFGILGFYLLRIALWNTHGSESISFSTNHISYAADYGWFKDAKKQQETEPPVAFSIQQIGYEEEEKVFLLSALEILVLFAQLKCLLLNLKN